MKTYIFGLFLCCSISIASATINVFDPQVSQEQIWTKISGQQPDSSRITIGFEAQKKANIERKDIYIVLAIDSSGSMSTSDGSYLRIDAAKQFLDKLNQSNLTASAALISWDDNIDYSSPGFTKDFGSLPLDRQHIDADGGTNLNDGLTSSIDKLKIEKVSAQKFIILLSDGQGIYTPSTTPGSPISQAIENNIIIFTIGLGNQISEKDLRDIAESTGGKFFPSPNAAALNTIFQDLGSLISNLVASNVVVTYSVPSNFNIVKSSVPPNIAAKGNDKILSWKLGAIPTAKAQSISFDVSSDTPGTYTLGSSSDSGITFVDSEGLQGKLTIKQATVTVNNPSLRLYTCNTSDDFKQTIVDSVTGVAVTKEVIANIDGTCPDVRLTLEMPPKASKMDIVLALDASGSMIQHYFPPGSGNTFAQEADNFATTLINNLNRIIGINNYRISIVSWDDEDISDDFMSPLTSSPAIISRYIGNLRSICNETDLTIYSVGLGRAIDVLDDPHNWPTDPDNTDRIIIFVTGESEFRPEAKAGDLNRQINRAALPRPYDTGSSYRGYAVYPLFLDIKQPSMQYNELEKISKSTGGGVPTSIGSLSGISNVISAIYNKRINDSIAYDVTLTDTIYPYLQITSVNPKAPITRSASDGSHTVNWYIGNMTGGKKWTGVIHTAINLNGLPVDYSRSKTSVGYPMASSTPISQLTYRWYIMKVGNRNIDLPEGRISISCGSPCPKCPEITPAPTSPPINETEKPIAQPEQKGIPGFEIWTSIAGIAATYLGYKMGRKSS